jgi:hypothetical protein
MTNDERCILQALINELYDWTRLFTNGHIPIDTKKFIDAYDGMGPSSNSTDKFDSKFQDVLRIATENFPNYKFRLRFQEREQEERKSLDRAYCKNKVFLEYTSFIFPDEHK